MLVRDIKTGEIYKAEKVFASYDEGIYSEYTITRTDQEIIDNHNQHVINESPAWKEIRKKNHYSDLPVMWDKETEERKTSLLQFFRTATRSKFEGYRKVITDRVIGYWVVTKTFVRLYRLDQVEVVEHSEKVVDFT